MERQTNLWKRYWAWELVWLVYGVVNTLAITFIAKQAEQSGFVDAEQANDLVLFLLLGTLVWAYLSAVLDDISLVVTWERWEGTIEHTLMAPVPRWVHLVGMAVFGVLHAIVRTLLILAIALPFFNVDFGQADWVDRRRRDRRRQRQHRRRSASWPACCRCSTRSEARRCRSWCRPSCCWSPASTTASTCCRGWLQIFSLRLARDVHPRRHPRRAHRRRQHRRQRGHAGHPRRLRGVPDAGEHRRLRGRRALGQEDREAEAAGIAT